MDLKNPQSQDELLAQRVQEGDREAFADLVRKYSERFYQLAYRLLQNRGDAEDMVQTAFLKFWQTPKNWNPQKNTRFTTWFYRVILNLCLDHLKKKRPILTEVSEAKNEYLSHNDAEWQLQQEEQGHFLTQALSKLPERQKVALTLCFYQGLKQQEAAEIMGIKIKAMESLLSRAKNNLKEKCQPYLKDVLI